MFALYLISQMAAKAWTTQYATKQGNETKVKKVRILSVVISSYTLRDNKQNKQNTHTHLQLAEMGFDPAKCRAALDKTGGDEVPFLLIVCVSLSVCFRFCVCLVFCFVLWIVFCFCHSYSCVCLQNAAMEWLLSHA